MASNNDCTSTRKLSRRGEPWLTSVDVSVLSVFRMVKVLHRKNALIFGMVPDADRKGRTLA